MPAPCLPSSARRLVRARQQQDTGDVMHKTGSLATVVNDVGVIHLPHTRIALAYLCANEADTALAAVAIGDSALRIVKLVSQLHG